MTIRTLTWLGVCICAAAMAQTPPASKAVGAVESIDPTSGQITLHTDSGPTLKVITAGGARFVRIPLGETSLAKATPISVADIDPGDRLLARGELSADKATLTASLIVVMSKAEIAKKNQADRADWQKRGVGGLVKSVDAAANQVVISAHTPEGVKPLTIELSANTQVRRYAPDSVKFTDAKPSSLSEIKPGDQVRALGEKSADGASYKAQEIVAGTFRNVAATVTTVDAAAKSITVTDLATKKPLVVRLNADSTLRKLPEMAARMIAMRTSARAAGETPNAGGQAAGAAPAGPPPGAGPGAGPAAAPGGAPGGMRGGRSGDFQQMLDRIPPIKLEDLKAGDAIIISSTQSADPSQVTAITVIAGVEPILSAAPAGSQRAAMLGSWNLDMNMGGAEQ